jgi:flavin reductase (DIM6/NTAB) family NADH-FMN oxidoreductase RutF
MRFLPSSVVVLTGTVAEPGAPPTRKSYKPYRGMTLSSFSSLSLSPEPVVTFNIRVPSSTLQAITIAKQFLIHILDASVEGARVADVFTKIFAKAPVPDTPYSGLSRSPFEFGKRENYFNVERKLVSAERRGKESLIILPRLRGKGIRNVLRCEVLESSPSAGKRKVAGSIYGEHRPSSGLLRVGDHVVVLARVVEILEGAGERDRDRRRDPLKSDYGLTYADGKYLYRRVIPPSPKGNVPEKETRSSEENRPLENNGALEGDLEEEENPR